MTVIGKVDSDPSRQMTYNLGVVVVGDSKVGKTSLIACYGAGTYTEDYTPTVGLTFITSVKINNEEIEVNIHDTGGSTKHETVRQQLYSKADVFIICFSVCERKSFQHIEQFWLNEIRRLRGGTPFVLVGCKVDERTGSEYHVQHNEGYRLAQELRCHYYECSVVTQRNVKLIFDTAVKIAMDLEPQAMYKSRGVIDILMCSSCATT